MCSQGQLRLRDQLVGGHRPSPSLWTSALRDRNFHGSFSAVSTPILAIKYSFCSIFRDLQNELGEFSKFFKKKTEKIENSGKFGKIREFH